MNLYRFVDGTFRVETVIKRSRFIATVCGEVDTDGAERLVQSISKEFADATHNCYAYISDAGGLYSRFSDDGEPGGTAGRPILEVLKKQGLTNTAVVVTRYFGGIKLGAGGLTGAYSGAVADVLKKAVISEKTECSEIEISTYYTVFPIVESIIRKTECLCVSVDYKETVKAVVAVPLDGVGEFVNCVKEASSGKIAASINENTKFYMLNNRRQDK